MKTAELITPDQLGDFDTVIDVRSPSEFAEDHIPGAINCPVLDDAQRALVGTLYVQDSPFKARKLGAALVARNIAQHLETHFQERDREWRPAVYCWRGGNRSGAMAHILRQVGWDAGQLSGGYRAWRRHVLEQLESLPRRIAWRVICGPTGSGKSRLLAHLARQDAQVLDLEAMAAHRGSVLGELPHQKQPGQKLFESHLYRALTSLDRARPVFVEAESKRIGSVRVPETLMECMRESPCLTLEIPLAARIASLVEDYRHYLVDVPGLSSVLERLVALHGHERIDRWRSLAQTAQWQLLVQELLEIHYDPAYRRSSARNYQQLGDAVILRVASLDDSGLRSLAAAARAAAADGCPAKPVPPVALIR